MPIVDVEDTLKQLEDTVSIGDAGKKNYSAGILDGIFDFLIGTIDFVRGGVTSIEDWIYDNLRKLRDWVIKKLLNFTTWLKLMKYRFRQLVKDVMGNVWGFWLTVAGITALVIAFPAIVKFTVKTSVYLYISGVWDIIKKGSGTILEKMHYIQMLEIHRIFLIINPNYTDFWADFDTALSGMAEEVELGVGVLSLLTYDIRNLYYSTYTMLGLDMDTIELKYYDDVSNFWSNSYNRWESYVRHPQSIFIDAMRELVFPVLQDQAKYGNEKAAHELEQAKKVDNTLVNIDIVRQDLNTLIADLPDDIEAAVNGHVGPFMDYVNEQFDLYIIPWQEKFRASVAIIEETNREIAEAVAANALRKPTVGDSFVNILFDGSLRWPDKMAALKEAFGRIYARDVSALNSQVMINIINDVKTDADIPPELKEQPLPLNDFKSLIDIPSLEITPKPWFVGEY